MSDRCPEHPEFRGHFVGKSEEVEEGDEDLITAGVLVIEFDN